MNSFDFVKPQFFSPKHFRTSEKKFGKLKYYPPYGINDIKWYKIFEKKLNKQLKKKEFFPLFRMSDGEFIFLLGRRFSQYNFKDKIYFIFQHIKRSIFYMSPFYSSGRKGYCERYSFFNLKGLRRKFFHNLKYISKKGFICPNFSPHPLVSTYQKDILKILNNNDIYLNYKNYFGYYFPTIFFLGKNIFKVFRNKKILIFTSNMPERNLKLKNNLLNFKAKKVDFYHTSLNNPMLDKIQVEKLRFKPDFILVAAGVGSVNIIYQLKHLKCACIDCGYIVDALSDISFAKKIIYHLNDFFYKKKKYF